MPRCGAGRLGLLADRRVWLGGDGTPVLVARGRRESRAEPHADPPSRREAGPGRRRRCPSFPRRRRGLRIFSLFQFPSGSLENSEGRIFAEPEGSGARPPCACAVWPLAPRSPASRRAALADPPAPYGGPGDAGGSGSERCSGLC